VDGQAFDRQVQRLHDQRTEFGRFAHAPSINPGVALIKGVVCGVGVGEVDDPLMRLAKGKPMEKILR